MQLGRMGEIYKGAEVVVWLGEEEEEGKIGEDVQRFEEVVRRVEGVFQVWRGMCFGRLVLQGNRNAYTCWDERDRLYAMVGICEFERLADWDYGRPFEELYLRFWAEVLNWTKEVNWLTYVEVVSARASRPRMSRNPEER